MSKISPPDARIDLHGMTKDQAYSALKNFLQNARNLGKKNVLIITGKGSLLQPSVIKVEVPRWLEYTELKQYVMSYSSANYRLGGEGAIIVTLRK